MSTGIVTCTVARTAASPASASRLGAPVRSRSHIASARRWSSVRASGEVAWGDGSAALVGSPSNDGIARPTGTGPGDAPSSCAPASSGAGPSPGRTVSSGAALSPGAPASSAPARSVTRSKIPWTSAAGASSSSRARPSPRSNARTRRTASARRWFSTKMSGWMRAATTFAYSRTAGAVSTSATGRINASYSARCSGSSAAPASMIAAACRSSIRPVRSASSVAEYVPTSAAPSPSQFDSVRSPTRSAADSSARISRSGIESPNSTVDATRDPRPEYARGVPARATRAASRCATRNATRSSAAAHTSARSACRRDISARFASARVTSADNSAQCTSHAGGSHAGGSRAAERPEEASPPAVNSTRRRGRSADRNGSVITTPQTSKTQRREACPRTRCSSRSSIADKLKLVSCA